MGDEAEGRGERSNPDRRFSEVAWDPLVLGRASDDDGARRSVFRNFVPKPGEVGGEVGGEMTIGELGIGWSTPSEPDRVVSRTWGRVFPEGSVAGSSSVELSVVRPDGGAIPLVARGLETAWSEVETSAAATTGAGSRNPNSA